VPIVLKSGTLKLLEPSGPVQACNGIALPLPYIKLHTFHCSNNRFLISNKSVLFQVERKVSYPMFFLIFRSCSKSGDCHNDRNYANYKKWLQEKLIPNLESKSVAVVDNVPDHNVLIIRNPTSNARKAEMLFWLDKHSSDRTKVESCTIS
jgi:hypothetical protein